MTPDGRPVHTASIPQPWSNGRQFVACSCPYTPPPGLSHPAGLVIEVGDDDD